MLKRFTCSTLLCLIFIFNILFVHKINAVAITDFIVPPGFTFNKDLIKGYTASPDMYFLQNILNMSTTTQVASYGPGSNSGLTSYYGDKTQSALGRFQSIFKSSIDYEKSISTSSGAYLYIVNDRKVDQYTRAVLNKLILIYSNQLSQYRNGYATSSPVATTTLSTTTYNGVNNPNGIYQPIQYTDTGSTTVATGTPVYNGGTSSASSSNIGTAVAVLAGSLAAAALIGGGSSSAGASAGTSAALTPFGGLVSSMMICTCSANTLLYVKDPRGPVLPLIYQPFVTVLYNRYTPVAGVNVLGKYVSGGQCLIYIGTGCSTGGVPIGTMMQLGTSSL